MAAHAKLGPSSAERWFSCPGSIAASVGMENKSGVFAAEGTAAHALAAWCLQTGKDAAFWLGNTVGARWEGPVCDVEPDGVESFEVTDEMADAVQEYLDLCRRFMVSPWEYDIEQRLDLTAVHKDVFGTGDFISYHPETKALIVVDYKHGKGHAVEVAENKQLMTYAVGAALRYHNRGLGAITLYVVQPRCPHKDGAVREANYDSVELLEFRSDLADAATATEAPDAPRVAGEWCLFCPAAAVCDERRALAMKAAEGEFGEVDGMSADRVAAILREADQMKDWIKRVENYAQAEAQHGRLPTGYKLVAKRATRKWKSQADAQAYLETILELDRDAIFVDLKMKSPAQIEAVIGKKRKGEIASLYEAVSSGANLVPVEDPRAELRPDAEKEFAE